MKRLLLILGIVSLVASPAYGLDIADKLTLSGLVKNETSLRLQEREERGDFMKVENTLQIGAEYRLMDNIHLFGLFRGFYEALYDIEDDIYDSGYKDEYKELRYPQGDEWLREAYVDLLFDWLDVRIGKQQVVWGTADGIKVLDAVNPTDMREFTLDDSRDSRIPLLMLKTELAPTTNGTLQFLFIPDFEPNYIPPLGSPFTFRATAIGAANVGRWLSTSFDPLPARPSYKEEEEIKPDPWENLDESTVGARWLDVIGGFEYTLNYLYGYYLSGANYSWFTDFKPMPPPQRPEVGDNPTLHLQKRYERIHLIGSSFSKALTKGLLAGLSIRGEFAYIKDVPGYYGTDGAPKGVVKLDNYNYVLGLDKNFFTNWLFSFQLIQFISSISEHEGFGLLFGPTLGPMSQFETILTLKVSTDFMHERLKPEVLVLYWPESWRISPKVKFEVFDYLNLAVGAHIFEGDEQNLFGQFDDNDQVFVELRYGF